MSTIRVVGSTMGVSTPATAGDGHAKPYRWRGHADWTPNHPGYREGPVRTPDPLPQNLKTMAGRAARIAEYTRLRLDGNDPHKAAAELGVTRSTRATYEKEYQDQQRREQAS